MLNNKTHCPAIIGIYYFIDGITSPTEIGKILGISTSTVHAMLDRKYNVTEKRRAHSDELLDEIEREYLDGASTYTLGDKYGVRHETIGKWMKQRGHVRGKGYKTTNKGTEKQKQRAIERDKQRLLAEGGKIKLVEYGGDMSTYRCTDCGLVFTRCRGYNHRVICPDCYSREIAEQKAIDDARREEERKQAEQVRLEEYAKEKHCAICGSVFHSETPNAMYCSKRCRTKNKINKKLARDRRKTAERQTIELKKDKTCQCCGAVFHSAFLNKIYCDDCAAKLRRSDHRLRAKKYKVAYEPGITVKKLIERDDNICQICGYPCDSNDLRYGVVGPLYPTIDHIIAMVNGGGHVWSNVQLAHFACNCEIKRDLLEDELTEEVIAHAKEQAIAHKCA